jgi:hypothetical protein
MIEMGVGQNQSHGRALECLFHFPTKSGGGAGAQTGVEKDQPFVESDARDIRTVVVEGHDDRG